VRALLRIYIATSNKIHCRLVQQGRDYWPTCPTAQSLYHARKPTHHQGLMYTRNHVVHRRNSHQTTCRHNGTQPYWPAVQCRPPDRPRARRPARPPLQTTDADRRRRQTPTTVTSLPLHYV